jgi:hypothetical protein
MSEEAARFVYRAQVCQRTVLRLQGKWGPWLFSWFLDGLAGYDYRAERSVGWYVVVIGAFADAYLAVSRSLFLLGLPKPGIAPLHWYEALMLSVSSFHGRGFFPGPGAVVFDSALTALATIETVIGLLIEISFIATFTQRFFSAK